jgi:MFS family permease
MTSNPLAFLVSSSSRERRALAASTLGWMLDGMDVTLYTMVIRELLRELPLTTSEAGLLASVTLVASALGGVLFGLLADRIGRRRALMASILVYSVFTAACGFSRGVWELAAFRLGVGLGMGGEWATGAALVSETWSAPHRGKALGLMQSGFAIGYALAAVVSALLLPRWGWRAVFFVGILPALVTLRIGRGVEESPLWVAQQKGYGIRGSRCAKEEFPARTPAISPGGHHPARHVCRSYAKPILVTLLMNSAALFAWWGLFTWIPFYLALPVQQGGRGLSLAASSAWILAMQAGMWLGYVTFGFISDAIGRKRTYITYLFVAALLVPLYARAQPAALLIAGPLLAFFGTGHFTGFGIITAELFPTSFRASAMGLTYNFGRALSAAAPWAIGVIAAHGGLASAFGISSLAFFLAGVLALALPETRGRTLA